MQDKAKQKPKKRPKKLTGFSKWVVVRWHGFTGIAPGWMEKALLSLMSVGLIAYPLFKERWSALTVVYVTVWLTLAMARAWRELTPRNMRLVHHQYIERKLGMYTLLQEMQRSDLTAASIRRFQRDALRLIANYVRGHRSDPRGTKIFVNLLVPEGNHMRVVERDRDHRERSTMLPKECSIAWKAFSTGEPQVTGDVYAECPDTPEGKPYRSIMALPVKLGREIVGVVCVDSSRPFHFDRDFKDLVDYLQPYVALLPWTLSRMSAIVPEPATVPVQVGGGVTTP